MLLYFCSKKRIVTNETLETEVNAPAPLNLPFGKLFFGYKIVPYIKPSDSGGEGSSEASATASGSGSGSASTTTPEAFTGSGNSLTGRSIGPASLGSSAKGKGKEKETPSSSESAKDVESKWGKGNRLTGGPPSRAAAAAAASSRRATGDGPVGAGGARAPRSNDRLTGPTRPVRERSPTPDWGVDDDDDVIYIDSD